MKKIMALVLATLASFSLFAGPALAQTITNPIPLGAVNGRVMWQPFGPQDSYVVPIQDASIYLSRVNDQGGREYDGYASTDQNGYFLLDQPNPYVPLSKYDFIVISRFGYDDVWEPISLMNGYNRRSDSFMKRKRVDIGITSRIEGNRLKWTAFAYANLPLPMPERWVANTIIGGTTFTSMGSQSYLGAVAWAGSGYSYVKFGEYSVEIPTGPQGTWIFGQVSISLTNSNVLTDVSSPAYFAVMRTRPDSPVFFADGKEFVKFQEAVRRGEDPTAVGKCVITVTPGKITSSMSVKPAKPTGPGFFTDPNRFNELGRAARDVVRDRIMGR